MSLVGFDHVFSDAQLVTLAGRLSIRVIPPVVLMLLKIVAFLDDQTIRAKDLSDIRALLSKYEFAASLQTIFKSGHRRLAKKVDNNQIVSIIALNQ